MSNVRWNLHNKIEDGQIYEHFSINQYGGEEKDGTFKIINNQNIKCDLLWDNGNITRNVYHIEIAPPEDILIN